MLRYFLFRLFYTALVLYLLPQFIGGIRVEGFGSALLAALLLAALNVFLKPILVLVTLPLTVATLGLFLCIVNGSLLYLAGYMFEGLKVDSFAAALLGAIVLTVAGWFVDKRDGKRFVFRYLKRDLHPEPRSGLKRNQDPERQQRGAFDGKTIDLEQKGDRWE